MCHVLRLISIFEGGRKMEDEDVPPLEDLSHVVTKTKMRPQPLYEPRVRMRTEPKTGTSASKPVAPAANKSEEKSQSSFGGFSKGFLLSTTTPSNKSGSKKKPVQNGNQASGGDKKAAESEKEDIPFIKPQAPPTKAPVLPEVQEAMKKEAHSLMDTQEWMTDSLLEKMEKHPLLSRALRDPTLARALAQFQTDPESVLRTAASNPQLQQILREFCAVMGSHFTELADKQDSEKHGEHYVALEEDEEVEKVLGKEGVKEALSDPKIQQLFSFLKDDPPKAQRMLSTASPELRQKVKLLIDNGLLAMQ